MPTFTRTARIRVMPIAGCRMNRLIEATARLLILASAAAGPRASFATDVLLHPLARVSFARTLGDADASFSVQEGLA
jgi:hypothetical protein